jgi:hypothetical protein
MTGTHQLDVLYRFVHAPSDRLKARIIRWAYPAPPCVDMAVARATQTSADDETSRTVATGDLRYARTA